MLVVSSVRPATSCFQNNLQFTPRGKPTNGFQTVTKRARDTELYESEKLFNQFVLSDQATQGVLWSANEKLESAKGLVCSKITPFRR